MESNTEIAQQNQSTDSTATPAAEPVVQHTKNPFLAQLVDGAKAVPKQSFTPAPDPGTDGDGKTPSGESPASDELTDSDGLRPESTARTVTDQNLAEAAVHVEMFDFVTSQGLAMWSDSKAREFTAEPDQKERLADALARYYATLDAPPQLPPWLMLLAVAVIVYAPKVKKAADIRKEKKKKPAPKPKETAPRFDEPKPFNINEQKESKPAATPPVDTNTGTEG